MMAPGFGAGRNGPWSSTMQADSQSVQDGVLEQLTLPELIDVWAEDEIYRRLQEIDLFAATIVREAQRQEDLLVMPLRGGSCEEKGSIEVLVEVRDPRDHRRCIGAWSEQKYDHDDRGAFERAYEKATAHAIIQLLPATTWRPWIGTRLT
jgi:hypothetical protein